VAVSGVISAGRLQRSWLGIPQDAMGAYLRCSCFCCALGCNESMTLQLSRFAPAHAAGIYQIIAGLVGLYFTFRRELTGQSDALHFNVYALAISLLSVTLGVSVWRQSRKALVASAVFQAIQVPRILGRGSSLAFLVGPELSLRFRWPQLELMFDAGVILNVGQPVDIDGTLGVNLLALSFALLLARTAQAKETRMISRHPKSGPSEAPGP